MKALHILSDEKFIDKHIARYDNAAFFNRYVYLNKINKYDGENRDRIEFVNQDDDKEIRRLADSANSFDAIFVYFLNYHKAKFVNYIESRNPIIVWFFFGAELYSSAAIKAKLLSLQTKLLLGHSNWSDVRSKIRAMLRFVKYGLKGELTPHNAFLKAVERVDYFAWYSEEEYDHIQKLTKVKLPKFLHVNIKLQPLINTPTQKDNISVLIGNSRDPLNNHVDIINLLDSVGFNGLVDIPFSYGSNKYYSDKIRGIVTESGLSIKLHEDFMPYNDYVKFVGEHSTAIYNSYRQMALGNILVALWSGLKVYLSINNPSYHWLKNSGFIIFSIEVNLESDLRNNDLVLNQDSVEHNYKLYTEISRDENNVIFNEKLYCLVRGS